MSRLSALTNSTREIKNHAVFTGTVTSIKGPILYAKLPHVALNDICSITKRNGQKLLAQAIGFKDELVTLAPFDDMSGVSPGSAIIHDGSSHQIHFPHGTGVIVNALGEEFIKPQFPKKQTFAPASKNAPCPLSRNPITNQMKTGVSSLDLFCPLGYGQRVGLFAGPGVGKSTLLGMIAKNADVDICVIALVGERGREVKEFIDESLGSEGLKRSIVVASTSDESPLRRKLAIQTATAIAESYRDQGKRVLLLVDSLTRVARAIRDVSLTAGEFPVRHGYTPSVYSELPKIIERAGNNSVGSITAIYTVLTSGPEELDPIAEELKGLLDGHICLNTETAEKGILPALDVTRSLSRLFEKLVSDDRKDLIRKAKSIITRIYRDKDMLILGGEADDELKAALSVENDLFSLIKQKPNVYNDLETSFKKLLAIIA